MKSVAIFSSARGSRTSYGAHTAVLLKESVALLDPRDGEVVLDATLGAGGHAEALLEAADITLIGLDRDGAAIETAQVRLARFGRRVIILRGNFKDAPALLGAQGIKVIHKAFFDLGISTDQLEASGRGFSFQKDEPVLMTMEAGSELTAKELLNSWSEEALGNAIFGYGGERFARRIARAIVARRQEKPFERTTDLVDVVSRAIPKRFRSKRINPATKTFQALRIAVNDELGSLRQGLAMVFDVMTPEGKVAVISFHSLEDREVKSFFGKKVKSGEATALTKKPIVPSEAEISANPRARSAKLRAIQKRLTPNA